MEQYDSVRQKAIRDAIRRTEWEGAPLPGVFNPTGDAATEDAIRRMEWEGAYIGQEQVEVKNSQFPERAGRTRPTASEIVEIIGPALGQPK